MRASETHRLPGRAGRRTVLALAASTCPCAPARASRLGRSKTNPVQPSVVVIDNYDSFTYNLVQYVASLGARCEVRLNDGVTVPELRALRPDGILLSPGPGTPDDAGVTLEVIRELSSETPVLGVCLGHQSIAQAFGGQVVRAERLMHGKTSPIAHDGRGVFQGLPSPFRATRYHSLIVQEGGLPECLEVSARTQEGEIMALRHRSKPVEGVQFHPESILTEHGMDMISNWLKSLGART
jgi:anthranilate synthase/aminodeoxychorismate synthase-like glutamine amidotransferase